MFSQESLRRAIQWLLVAPAGLATLAPAIPGEGARAACLRVAGWLLVLDGALLACYALRFGRAFLAFLVRRLALMLVTLTGITMVTFVVIRFAPGDPVTAQSAADGMAPARFGVEMDIHRTRRELLGSQATHLYRAAARDPDGDRVRLEFDWGDGSPSWVSSAAPSDTEFERAHSWRAAGNYLIRVRASDEHGATSAWSAPLRVEARQGAPLLSEPPRPQGLGLDRVETGKSVPFVIELPALPDGATVLLDWGDGTPPSRAIGDRGLMDQLKWTHAWSRPGVYRVRARAVGPREAVSDWSEALQVVVFDPGRPLVGPVLNAASNHARPGEPVTVTARAFSRGAADLRYELRVAAAGLPARERAALEPADTRAASPGQAVELSATFSRAGDYILEVTVLEAESGVEGPLQGPSASSGLPVAIDDNRAPLTPAPPSGPTSPRVETTILEQYLWWLSHVARLDFGRSHVHGRDVWPLIWYERLPNTLILSAISLLLAYLIAIPAGVYSATHQGSITDRCLGLVLFTLHSLPSFWVATMLIVLVAGVREIPLSSLSCVDPSTHRVGAGLHVPLLGLCLAVVSGVLAMRLGRRGGLGPGLRAASGAGCALAVAVVAMRYLPATGLTRGVLLVAVPLACALLVLLPRDGARAGRRTARSALVTAGGTALLVLFVLYFFGRLLTFDLFWHALLPVVCLTYGGLAVLSRYARSGMLEVVQQDYIRTARAKGLPERTVIFKHALRNGLIPILTLFASILPQLISGSVIIESIFTIQGMGHLMIESVGQRDYNVVMAITTLTAAMTMVGLLLSDVLYVIVDPRISFEKRTTT